MGSCSRCSILNRTTLSWLYLILSPPNKDYGRGICFESPSIRPSGPISHYSCKIIFSNFTNHFLKNPNSANRSKMFFKNNLLGHFVLRHFYRGSHGSRKAREKKKNPGWNYQGISKIWKYKGIIRVGFKVKYFLWERNKPATLWKNRNK